MLILDCVVAALIAMAPVMVKDNPAKTVTPPVSITGSGASPCAGCHAEAVAAWQGSHHARAMQHADPDTVQGAFDNQVLIHAGEQTVLSRQADRFLATVSSPGTTSGSRQFKILYTFGVSPLQQYLVEIEPGRLQALPWAWDTRPKAEGGGRWYHLYEGNDVPPGDRLHWQSPLQNWNGMCADCHSTGLARNYDIAGDRFSTTATSINISCASCHGSAADHVLAMKQKDQRAPGIDKDVIHFRDASSSRFEREDGMTTALNSAPPHKGQEIEICAACHSRRTPLTARINPRLAFLDQFTPALLDDGLYHADGQIRDEVYVWGSFMQSKMAAAGVTCSHCHEAHSLDLKRGGNTVCTACHAPEAFDTRDHHRHPPGSEAAQCVSCHMPQTTYMGIDARRDHAFKVPRPDLSQSIGTPNACTTCHTDLTNDSASTQILNWNGPREINDATARTIAAARARDPAARAPLRALIEDKTRPALTRASALSLVPDVADRTLLTTATGHVSNEDPLIRIGAIRALTALAPEERASILAPILDDEIKAVRMEAARALQGVPASAFSGEDRQHFKAAITELLATTEEIAWRGEGRLAHALIHQGQNNPDEAAQHYRKSLELDPSFAPSYINLSELLRSEGTGDEVLALLRDGLDKAPGDAALEHALGLALIRAGKTDEAMIHLENAADLAPQSPRFAWVHAVALHSAGKISRARARLETALARHPHDPDLLTLSYSLASETGDRDAMLTHARHLSEIFPDTLMWKDIQTRLNGKPG